MFICEFTSDTVWVMYVPALTFAAILLGGVHNAGSARQRDAAWWAPIFAAMCLGALVALSPDRYISAIEAQCFLLLYASVSAFAKQRPRDLVYLALSGALPLVAFVVMGIPQALSEHVNAHGFFHDSNLFAGLLTSAAAVLAGVSQHLRSAPTDSKAYRLALTLAIVLVAGAYLGHSRGAWLGLWVATAVTLLSTRSVTRVQLKAVAIVLLVIGMAGLVGTGHKTHSDLAQHDGYGQSTNSRLAMWESTLSMIHDHPVKGVGFGLWHLAYPTYRTAGDTDSAGFRAHNDYLESLATGGPLGLLVVGGIAALWCVALWRARRRPVSSPWLFVGASIGAGVFVVQALVNFEFHEPAIALFAGFLLGAMYAATRRDSVSSEGGGVAVIRGYLLPATVLAWTILMYLAMAPTLILADPTGFDGKALSPLMAPAALLRLAKANPLAADPWFVLGHEKTLDGLVERDPKTKAAAYELAYAYYTEAEKRQGIQPATSFRKAMLVLDMPGLQDRERALLAAERLQEALAHNPAYIPALKAYVHLMARHQMPGPALAAISKGKVRVPVYQRQQFDKLRSALIAESYGTSMPVSSGTLPRGQQD
jgi:O-antigen ligase